MTEQAIVIHMYGVAMGKHIILCADLKTFI